MRYFVLAILAIGLFVFESHGQMAAIAAIDEPETNSREAVGAVGAAAKGSGSSSTSRQATRRRSTSAGNRNSSARSTAKSKASAKATPAPAKYDGFVVGDKYTFLNFEVVSAEKPYHTRAAKANGAKGLVQVEVLIETNGTVVEAKGRTGNKELWPEAERAALASKFNRPTFGGKPARAIGFLVYRFGPAED